MTRQLEQEYEVRQARRSKLIVEAVEYALEGAINHSGAEFYGFAAKFTPGECLLVIKGDLAGRRQVAFVGSEDFGSAMLKAVRLGKGDKLKWRDDKYST